MESKSVYSYRIKDEILSICEAFNLGEFIGLLYFEESSKVDGYVLTYFETSIGVYSHYYKIKE